MDQRIKGQEFTLNMTQDGTILAALDSIQNFEATIKLEKKQEGYVGETTDRYDDVMHGVDGGFSIHFTTQSVFDIVQAMIDRARRRLPGTKFNLKGTFNFPNGERRRVALPDVFFGNLPIGVPARADYATMKLDFSCSQPRFI